MHPVRGGNAVYNNVALVLTFFVAQQPTGQTVMKHTYRINIGATAVWLGVSTEVILRIEALLKMNVY